MLTRSKAFQKLASMTYDLMDTDKSGEIDKVELYAGLLMVHLKLAKYAGAAACYVRTVPLECETLSVFVCVLMAVVVCHNITIVLCCGDS